jgi:alkylation response protein AidB-like acyl-CoA dehydrogenase
MAHYRSNVRDLQFVLFEMLEYGSVLGQPPYAEIDADTARSILAEVARLAENELAASFEEGDRKPPVFDPDTHTAKLPEGFRRSFHAMMDAGWHGLEVGEKLGGTEAPRSLWWAVSELLLGANPAAYMYAAGPGFAAVLRELGTPDQQRLAELMVARGWGSTMVLTEPRAGSDVGAGRTSAARQPDGTWHLQGTKRFITSAEHDLTDNIVHLVLARPEGARSTTKGLSLFVVPKFLVDLDTGELGERNGVFVTNVEHKMGLKVSTTCELTFGAEAGRPAVGYLVGDVHDGIAQMFRLIENARMMVGAKGIATLSTGYLNALDYARNRVQGGDLTQLTDKTAPRVTIIHHPDVRRMLMLQKSYAEGMRALLLYTASIQDRVRIAAGRGENDGDAAALNDLLLPIVKGVGSERSYELLALSLQTLGGSGYLQDYPIEQYIRDAKIDSVYEGTTGIQAQDLFFRKIVRDNGQALGTLLGEVKAFADGDAGNGRLKNERALLGQALADVQGIAGAMVADLKAAAEQPNSVYGVGLNANRLLMTLGDLVIGWLLLRQAEIALGALTAGASDRDQPFYEGKVAAATFFVQTRLPLLSAERAIAENRSLEIMEIDEAAF